MNKAVIFDFDGTLVDSKETIYKCFQSVTRELAPDRISYAKNILIGPQLKITASKILGLDHQDKLDQFVKKFIQKHDDRAIFDTLPYPGVDRLLKKLALMDVPMAIATNKRKIPTIKLIEHFGWSSYFYSIQCSDSELLLKNKCEMIHYIIKNGNNKFINPYFVGDTLNDGISANLHQLKFIRALYGYGQNQDWSNIIINKSIEGFEELDEIFN